MSERAFDILEPASGESPVLVEIPHAGLSLDPEALAFTNAPARSIARDADLYVDLLFRDAPATGATLLVARTSRYLVDLNRGETDVDGDTVEGAPPAPPGRGAAARGLVWRLTTEGAPILDAPLPRSELERRLALVYRPYHRALEDILQRKRARFGFAILLCAHSMPSRGRGGFDAGVERADVVPGSRGRTSAASVVIDSVDVLARASGFSVRHDDPYRGGYSTGQYGTPQTGVHAVQVELARRLYMDEASFRMDPQPAQAVRQFARALVARLATIDADLRPHGRGNSPR